MKWRAVGVVHLVQLQARVGLEQTPPGLEAEGERMLGLVDFGATLAHGNEKGLRQPRRAERGSQMGQGAIGRADQDGWVAARGILMDHQRAMSSSLTRWSCSGRTDSK